MSENYVKEILEKLEEIEKLHAKLRSLVPRAKDVESENKSNAHRKGSTNMEDKHPVTATSNENKINSEKQEPTDSRRDSELSGNTSRDSKTKLRKMFDSNGRSMKYLKKFRDRSENKFKRLRSNSIDYVTKQWQDKNGKLKNLLSSINEPDIILVTRAVQTADGEVNIITEPFQRKKSTLQDISGWLLQHFDNSRDSNLAKSSTASIQGTGIGNDKPRRVQKTLFIPDKESETLKIISSAKRISLAENGKLETSGSRARKLSGKFTDIRLHR